MPEIDHINVKLFATAGSHVPWHTLIPIYHRWIQQAEFPELLLIDVADYAHVPEGPGVMLIGHHALISVDNREGRPGLLYNRRTALVGSLADKIRHSYRGALAVARRLESEPEVKGALTFSDSELEVFVNDRLLAPNVEETWQQLKPAMAEVFGNTSDVRWPGPSRELFRVKVSGASAGVENSAIRV